MNDVTNLHGPDDPETEELLSGALHRRAESIHPGDGLADIRARTHRARPGRVLGVVAAAVVGVVAGGAAIGMVLLPSGPNGALTANNGNREPAPAATPASGAPSSAPTGSTTPSIPPDTPASTTAGKLPVYWIGPDNKLYREYRTGVAASSPAASAIETMLGQDPLDPDYRRGPWQPASGVTVTQDGQDLVVDLPAAALATGTVDRAEAEAALQQLVYTATAVTQAQGTVTVLIDGKPGTAWGQVPVGEPVSRDGTARAAVWIISPQQDDAVRAGTVTITGSATAFEANVTWTVTDADGSLVAEGYTMAGSMGRYESFSFEVELKPGTYTVTVIAPDASGRTDGTADNHTFTVR